MNALTRITAYVNAWTMRERLLVLGAGAAMICTAWYVGFAQPALVKHKRLAAQIDDTRAQLDGTRKALAQHGVTTHATAGPDARLGVLQQRTAQLDAEIAAYTAELISPTDMAQVLERVLERAAGLRLIRLRNLGPQDLLGKDFPGERRLYRHQLAVELEGTYIELLKYLEELEALPWRLYWQRLEIDASEYARSRFRLEVATLSLDEEWIGV